MLTVNQACNQLRFPIHIQLHVQKCSYVYASYCYYDSLKKIYNALTQNKYIIPLPSGCTAIHCGVTDGGNKGVGLGVAMIALEVAVVKVEVELTAVRVELSTAVRDGLLLLMVVALDAELITTVDEGIVSEEAIDDVLAVVVTVVVVVAEVVSEVVDSANDVPAVVLVVVMGVVEMVLVVVMVGVVEIAVVDVVALLLVLVDTGMTVVDGCDEDDDKIITDDDDDGTATGGRTIPVYVHSEIFYSY